MNSQKMDKSTRMSLGKQIKEAREKRALTQAEVAEKADMTVNYFAMIERGEVNPSFDKIKGIARVLKVKLMIF